MRHVSETSMPEINFVDIWRLAPNIVGRERIRRDKILKLIKREFIEATTSVANDLDRAFGDRD
jgi:hypothetical protein